MDDIFHPPLLLYMEIIIYICYYCRHHFDAFIFFGISICFCLKRLDHLFVGIFINWHFNRLHYPVQLYLFCFFIAYFIGNIKERVPFHILYYVHLISAAVAANFSLVLKKEFFLTQIPFVVITLISAILLPFSIRSRKERERLEERLEDANERIAELVKLEERQRIARDLHDTLGQKLSLIGLKSDLARKLIYKDPEQAGS